MSGFCLVDDVFLRIDLSGVSGLEWSAAEWKSRNIKRRRQMVVVGVDGCPAGWFAVRLGDGVQPKMRVFPSITELWAEWQDAELMLIDIPIGLRDGGHQERLCDPVARRLLGQPRGSSVFPAPCWAAAHATDYGEAVEINRCATRVNDDTIGRGLSRQCWGICRKIREVNDFLLAHAGIGDRFREVHPEVCFWAFNHGLPMEHGKKTHSGFAERRAVLRGLSPVADTVVDRALVDYRRNTVAKDDILDALVSALTAAVGIHNLVSIPANPEFDPRGLRMEMVHSAFIQPG